MPPRGTVSLPRALSKLGLCSRAEGERLVREGRVRVDGRVIRDVAFRLVPERADIRIDGEATQAPAKVYLAMHKPRGVLTTRHDPRGRPTVYDLLGDPALPFVGPVGRLDQASAGLLLLTNDTQWANAITAPASHLVKIYHVQVRPRPMESQLARWRQGVEDAGEVLRVHAVEELRHGERTAWLRVELTEGRNRQIRRMCAASGLGVEALVRVQIGPLALGALPKGAWRHLTTEEAAALRVSS